LLEWSHEKAKRKLSDYIDPVLHALIEAFQLLGQRDEKAAEILKRFNLL